MTTTTKRGRPKIHFTPDGRPEDETKICIAIETETWRTFRALCVTRGVTVKSELTKLIEAYLKKSGTQSHK